MNSDLKCFHRTVKQWKLKQGNKEGFVKRLKIWMTSRNKYESVLLNFLPVITLIILTSIFISSTVFNCSFSALIWCLWTMIITIHYFLCLWTVTNALSFVFLLIYVVYHVMFYSVETAALDAKSIMTVWLISVQLQICVGHILNMIITSWRAT